mmetsp:Transcript_123965/g.309839  ORF Transcript_123965/g.309839 Transcript_123965/m.309839 type:complete len:257 (-) Transcript_123965:1615-2385(-)
MGGAWSGRSPSGRRLGRFAVVLMSKPCRVIWTSSRGLATRSWRSRVILSMMHAPLRARLRLSLSSRRRFWIKNLSKLWRAPMRVVSELVSNDSLAFPALALPFASKHAQNARDQVWLGGHLAGRQTRANIVWVAGPHGTTPCVSMLESAPCSGLVLGATLRRGCRNGEQSSSAARVPPLVSARTAGVRCALGVMPSGRIGSSAKCSCVCRAQESLVRSSADCFSWSISEAGHSHLRRMQRVRCCCGIMTVCDATEL